MTDVIILQRALPHTRLRLFTRLWEEFGWKVVSAQNPPKYKLQVDGDYEFLERYDFRFPNSDNPYRCDIPLGKILRETGAKAVISEFSMRMSSTFDLVARRRLMGGPVTLFWSHGYNMDRGLGGLRRSLIQWPRSMLAALADGHVCYSEEGRDYLSRYMSSDRLFVARNTVDVTHMQAIARNTVAAIPPGRPHIMTIGRLTLDKDFPRLVRIFHRLCEDFPSAALTIIGDGVDTERTRVAAGSSLGDSIIMTGAIYEEEELAPLLLSADAVVFTGAVGLSVNHVLAYGVPVIAFDRTPTGPYHHPEIAYVVDGITGYRVPQNTDEALFTTLRDFFTRHADPKAEFRDSIEDYVAKNLTIDTYVEDFREVNNFIQELLRK